MDAHVTNCAVLVARVEHVVGRRERLNAVAFASVRYGAVVAFKAEREDDRSAKKPRVGRPVRIVANFTAFYPDRRMLKREWPQLVDMAPQTGFFVR